MLSTGEHCPQCGILLPLLPLMPCPVCPTLHIDLFTPVERASTSAAPVSPVSHGAEQEVSTLCSSGALDPQGPCPGAGRLSTANMSPAIIAWAAERHSWGHHGCEVVFAELLKPCCLSLGVLRDWGSDVFLNLKQPAVHGYLIRHLSLPLSHTFCSPAFPAPI